jgi:hypothetical protein
VTDLRRARAAAQLLHRPPGVGLHDAVRRLLAVQAQDLRSARLALRARAAGLSAADVDAALDEGSLLVGWLNRGTLQLVAADDYAWLHALTAPGRFAANARRLHQEGVAPDHADRAVAVIERALADEGPLTRSELAERVAARSIRTEGQAMPHLLMLTALRGIAVLGPLRGDTQAFALARDWLGAPSKPPDRDAALRELARRYLAAHAPADAADLAAWAGLPLRDARAGLRATAAEPARSGARAIPARLLSAFDPYLLGWKDRSFAVPAEHAKRVHPGGGMLRATATVDGVAVGTWTLPRGEVALDLFAAADPRALEAEARDVERFVTSARPS